MRKINRDAQAAERAPRPTTEDLIRYAAEGKPNRLSPGELDPVTGVISWPPLLREKRYEPNRKKLELLYADRSAAGYLSGEQVGETRQLLEGIMSDMKANIKSYPSQMYVSAKKFLQSLGYEAMQRPM